MKKVVIKIILAQRVRKGGSLRSIFYELIFLVANCAGKTVIKESKKVGWYRVYTLLAKEKKDAFFSVCLAWYKSRW